MIIREMTKEDWEQVATIYGQGIETNLATFETKIPTFEAWDEGHLEAGRLVAEVDGKVAGWAAFSPTSSRAVFKGVVEVSIYIHNDYKNKGIGKKLFTLLDEVALKEGIWTIYSCIMANNEASIALHTACGYRMIGYREKHGKDQYGEWRDTVIMEKRNHIL